MAANLKEIASSAVEGSTDELKVIGEKLWSNPGLASRSIRPMIY